MKNKFKKSALLPALLAAAAFFGSCSDPIFYYISWEVPPRTARIPGSPTNMAVLWNHLFVASGQTIHFYHQQQWNSWETITGPQTPFDSFDRVPGGRITALAATDTYLYALSIDNVLRRFDPSAASWVQMDVATGGRRLQAIFAPNPGSGRLFIALGSTVEQTSVLLIEGSATQAQEIIPNSGRIVGAAYEGGSYFLAAGYIGPTAHSSTSSAGNHWGNHIFAVPSGSAAYARITGSDAPGNGFTGIIAVDNSVLAIDRQGNFFDVTESSFARRLNTGTMPGYATGVLAVYTDHEGQRVLLAGRQGSITPGLGAFNLGYMEVAIDPASGITGPFHAPGRTPSGVSTSVVNPDRFGSTLGRHGLSDILQVPPNVCTQMRLFAVTHTQGLWSHRDHFDNGEADAHWNAED